MDEAIEQHSAALRAAVRIQDTEAIRTLVKMRPQQLDRRCARGWTHLIAAAHDGALESARCLLELGADPNATNPNGTTPLMYAKGHYLRSGDGTMMTLLLDSGADSQARDSHGLRLIDYVPVGDRARVNEIIEDQ